MHTPFSCPFAFLPSEVPLLLNCNTAYLQRFSGNQSPYVKVSTLSCQSIRSYPHRYNRAFAFSTISYPHLLRYILRLPTPYWERDLDLPRFPSMTYQDDLGSVYPPAVLRPCVPRLKQNNRLHTFWFKRFSILRLFVITAFINSSHMLTLSSHNLAPYHPMLTVTSFPHGMTLRDSLSQQLNERLSPILHCC